MAACGCSDKPVVEGPQVCPSCGTDVVAKRPPGHADEIVDGYSGSATCQKQNDERRHSCVGIAALLVSLVSVALFLGFVVTNVAVVSDERSFFSLLTVLVTVLLLSIALALIALALGVVDLARKRNKRNKRVFPVVATTLAGVVLLAVIVLASVGAAVA